MFSPTFIPRFKTVIRTIQQLLLPSYCLLCSSRIASPAYLCHACKNELPILTHFCLLCAQAMPKPTPRCGICLISPPAYTRALCLFDYKSPIDKLITQLKFQQQLSCAAFFGAALTDAFLTQWYAPPAKLPHCLIPVPLHVKRLQSRGFNQAIEIARPISKQLRIPIDYHNVKRIIHTLPQHSLSARKRKNNLNQAFSAASNYHQQHVAIIDDVMTTGHTTNALARLLRTQGASQVDVICVARCSLF